jgi:hypothetical protein
MTVSYYNNNAFSDDATLITGRKNNKDKERSAKHHREKTKDRTTRTPLKTGG